MDEPLKESVPYSGSQAPPVQSPPYEETPPIVPQYDAGSNVYPNPQSSPVENSPKRPSPLGSILTTLIVFAILFAVGYLASGYIRQYLADRSAKTSSSQETGTLEPVETVAVAQTVQTTPFIPQGNISTPSGEGTAPMTQQTYRVLNGVTRNSVPGVSYELPAGVLAPVCDGASCGSQGTYLPGGTRFTIAARGKGQVLADFRNKIISDLSGQEFTVKDTTVGGKKAVEFTGTFTGSTVGGYAFTKMHGIMVELTDELSCELNHFSPNGITTDFEGDDAVFATIIQSFQFTPASVPTVQ